MIKFELLKWINKKLNIRFPIRFSLYEADKCVYRMCHFKVKFTENFVFLNSVRMVRCTMLNVIYLYVDIFYVYYGDIVLHYLQDTIFLLFHNIVVVLTSFYFCSIAVFRIHWLTKTISFFPNRILMLLLWNWPNNRIEFIEKNVFSVGCCVCFVSAKQKRSKKNIRKKCDMWMPFERVQ